RVSSARNSDRRRGLNGPLAVTRARRSRESPLIPHAPPRRLAPRQSGARSSTVGFDKLTALLGVGRGAVGRRRRKRRSGDAVVRLIWVGLGVGLRGMGPRHRGAQIGALRSPERAVSQ